MTLEEYKNEIKEILIKDFKRTETEAKNIINHNKNDIEMCFQDELTTKEVATIINHTIYETIFKK